MSERDRIGEIQDRVRRIETRLTAWMEKSGFDTQVQKGKLIMCYHGRTGLEVPSLDVRLKDILETIAESRFASAEDEVPIFHKGERVGAIKR
jgi:hypothetical protein